MAHMTSTVCIVCGVDFALPTTLYERHRDHGGYHHCPNGHSIGWSKDSCTLEAQRREIERLKQDAARLEDHRRAAERRAAQAKADLAKVKKRAEAALCPCCNRSFVQLARHMRTKHPDVVPMPVRRLP